MCTRRIAIAMTLIGCLGWAPSIPADQPTLDIQRTIKLVDEKPAAGKQSQSSNAFGYGGSGLPNGAQPQLRSLPGAPSYAPPVNPAPGQPPTPTPPPPPGQTLFLKPLWPPAGQFSLPSQTQYSQWPFNPNSFGQGASATYYGPQPGYQMSGSGSNPAPWPNYPNNGPGFAFPPGPPASPTWNWTLGVKGQIEFGGGLRVTYVAPYSPAERIGIEVGDVIQSVDGRPLLSMADYFQSVTYSNGLVRLIVRDVRSGLNRQAWADLQW